MEFPFAIDILTAEAPEAHVYDLPFHYSGHLINSSFDCRRDAHRLVPAGNNYGYEHLWLESQTPLSTDNASFTWLLDDRFYSVTTTLDNGASALMTRIGAHDPNRNLRSEPAVIFRQTGKARHTFASVIEPHGLYDLQLELTRDADPQVEHVDVVYDDADYTAVEIRLRKATMLFVVVNRGFDAGKQHKLKIGNRTVKWKGNYSLIK